MMKQFDHMIEPKLNLELSNVFPRLKFLAGCGQFSDFSNNGSTKTQKHSLEFIFLGRRMKQFAPSVETK
jgi:hypothetical protein